MGSAKLVSIPRNKIDLINLYRRHDSEFTIKDMQRLEPARCAVIGNKTIFDSSPYESLIDTNNGVSQIIIKNNPIYWIQPSKPKQLLDAVKINNVLFDAPCAKRIAHIERCLDNLEPLFSDEIEFITDFISCIFWMHISDEGENLLGNAAFSEIPHAVFFSDYGLYSLPPEICVPHKNSEYAAFENLYHEALHHQMHAYANLGTSGYFESNIVPSNLISLDWRDRNFTILEAFHALHIYSLVTPLRYKYFHYLNEKNNSDSLDWLHRACQDGLRMWRDLSKEMLMYAHMFKTQWKNLIIDFTEDYVNFADSNIVEVSQHEFQ